jgi:hypothetical protein
MSDDENGDALTPCVAEPEIVEQPAGQRKS